MSPVSAKTWFEEKQINRLIIKDYLTTVFLCPLLMFYLHINQVSLHSASSSLIMVWSCVLFLFIVFHSFKTGFKGESRTKMTYLHFNQKSSEVPFYKLAFSQFREQKHVGVICDVSSCSAFLVEDVPDEYSLRC